MSAAAPGEAKARLLAAIRGSGLEIGAFHSPLDVPCADRVRYVDLLDREAAARFYPEADTAAAVTPDLVCPADDLHALEDASVDFVLASHLLEHLADPLGALQEWSRVVRPGGHLLVVLPDARLTFDRARGHTPLEHVIADHEEGAGHPERRRRDREHYREWARWVNRLEDPAQAGYWGDLLHRAGYPIHFHCWSPEGFLEVVDHLAARSGRVRLEGTAIVEGAEEFSVLLRRLEAG